MAPPFHRAQPDPPAAPTRRETLAGQQNEQEHGKRKLIDWEAMRNLPNDKVSDAASSGSDSMSLGKRSSSPEAREPLGGAELQRPPKMFFEENGLRGLAGELPEDIGAENNADDMNVQHQKRTSKKEEAQDPEQSGGFFKHGTLRKIVPENSPTQRNEKYGPPTGFALHGRAEKHPTMEHGEGLNGVQEDVQHHHADQGLVGVKDKGIGPPADAWLAETHYTLSRHLRQDRLPDRTKGFFKEGTIGSIEMDDTFCSNGLDKLRKRCVNTVNKRDPHSSKEIASLDHEEGLPGVEDETEHHHDDEGNLGVADNGVSEETVNLDDAAASAPGAMNLQQDHKPDHSGGFFKEGTVGSIGMDDTACHGEECSGMEKRSISSTTKLEAGALGHEEGLPGIEDETEHHHDDEGTVGVLDQGTAEPVDLDEAAASAAGAMNLQQDYPPDHSGGFFKEGTVGSIPMDETHCHDEECGALTKRDETTGNGEQAKPDPVAVSDNDWSSAIHGAVSWAYENKVKGSEGLAEVPALEGVTASAEGGEPGTETQPLDEAAIEAEAEKLVKVYYDEHPEEKAEVLRVLGELAQENSEAGTNQSMEDLVKEGAAAAEAVKTSPVSKRNIHDAVNEIGKGKEHYHAKPLDPTSEEGLSGIEEDGTAEPIPEDEAAKQAAADEALIKGDVPERNVDAEEWTKGLPEPHSGPEIDQTEAAAQAPGAMMLTQDHAPDHSGGFLKEGTVGSIPLDDTACHGDDRCDSTDLTKRALVNPPYFRPCIIKSGLRSGNCGEPLQSPEGHSDEVGKRGIAHDLVNEYGKGKHHFHPENKHVPDEGLHTVPDHGYAEPVPQDEAALQAPADEALHRSSTAPPHIEDTSVIHGLPEAKEGPPIDLDEAAAQAPGAHMLHQDYPPDHSGGFLKEGTVGSIPMDDTACHGDCLKKRATGIHDLINEKGKGKEHDHTEKHVLEEGLHSVQDGGVAEPVDQEEAAKNWAAHEAILSGAGKPQPTVEDEEWTKGIDKNDENDGNPVPKHAKRLDVEDWRDDGFDEVDVKFSQRLGESGKGKHHNGGKGHHSREHHSREHHQTSTLHHSKDHHATSTVHTRSYSAPPRAPGHALPSSRVGGFRFTKTVAATDAGEITPTATAKADHYRGKHTHTAAVSGRTSAAPSRYRVALTGTVPRPQPTAKTTVVPALSASRTAAAAAEPALQTGYPLEPLLGKPHSKAVSSTHPAQPTGKAAGAYQLPHGNKPEYEQIANHGGQAFEDDYRAYEKLHAATLNSVTPDSSTAQLLAESERAATELNHGRVKGQADPKPFGKRSNTRSNREKTLKGHNLKNFHNSVWKHQEKDMYAVIDQQAPVITSEEYAAIQRARDGAEKQQEPKKKFRDDHRAVQQEPKRAEFRKTASKAHSSDVKTDEDVKDNGDMAAKKDDKSEHKLGKRRIPQVKEEEDAKMRGYANSHHLAGAAARKDREKAAESVKEIAKNLEEGRAAAQYAAEHRAEKLMEKAEAKASKKLANGKAGKSAEYMDHDTYDPIKAHAAEDEEEAMEEDMREGGWNDVHGAELVDHSAHGHKHGNGFAAYQVGGAAATGLPKTLGSLAQPEVGAIGLVLIIGAWLTVVLMILRIARRRTEGETGWLKGRRPARRTDAQYLEDMEEGGMEKRYE